MVEAVSDITTEDLADYLRIVEMTESEEDMLGTMLSVAIQYCKTYTGQDDLDAFADMPIVIFVLVQDMWDNRTLYVDKNNTNKVVESILGLHSINLLPLEENDA